MAANINKKHTQINFNFHYPTNLQQFIQFLGSKEES